MKGAWLDSRSSGPIPVAATAHSTKASALPWLRHAPFGSPDVPEVYRMYAGSSGRLSCVGAARGASASRSSTVIPGPVAERSRTISRGRQLSAMRATRCAGLAGETGT